MRKTAGVIALGASIAVLLTACGGTEESGEEAATQTPATPDSQPSAPAVTETAEEAPTDPAGIAESYGLTPVLAGESVTYEWAYSNKPEQPMLTEVGISEYECGLPAIVNGMSNPEWDGGDTYPRDIDAPAEPGKEFCTFTITYENVGNFPGTPPAPAGVLIGPQQHDPSTTDHDISWNIQDYSHEMNPGETWAYTHVVSVPEGTTPDALLYPRENVVDVPTLAFLLD